MREVPNYTEKNREKIGTYKKNEALKVSSFLNILNGFKL